MAVEVEHALRPELGPGERLLWSGVPRQGVRFNAGDIFLVPFSLLWCGFAIFWEVSTMEMGAPLFFSLWGVPFVLVGLYIVVGRFIVDSYQRSRIYYGVTDQRILIISGVMSRNVKSIRLQGLNDISLRERSDRSGSITFGPSSSMDAMWSGSSWPGMNKRAAPAFDVIDDVRDVYNIILDAQRQPPNHRAI